MQRSHRLLMLPRRWQGPIEAQDASCSPSVSQQSALPRRAQTHQNLPLLVPGTFKNISMPIIDILLFTQKYLDHSKQGGITWLSRGQVLFSCIHLRRQLGWYLCSQGVFIICPIRLPFTSRTFQTRASVVSGCKQIAQTSSIISSPSLRLIYSMYLKSFPFTNCLAHSIGPSLSCIQSIPLTATPRRVTFTQRERSIGKRSRQAGQPFTQQRRRMLIKQSEIAQGQTEFLTFRITLKRTCRSGERAQRVIFVAWVNRKPEPHSQAQQISPSKDYQGYIARGRRKREQSTAPHPMRPIIMPRPIISASLLASNSLITRRCDCSSHPMSTQTKEKESLLLSLLKESIMSPKSASFTSRWATAIKKTQPLIGWARTSMRRVELFCVISRVLLKKQTQGMMLKFFTSRCSFVSSQNLYQTWASPSQKGQALLMLQLRQILIRRELWYSLSWYNSSTTFCDESLSTQLQRPSLTVSPYSSHTLVSLAWMLQVLASSCAFAAAARRRKQKSNFMLIGLNIQIYDSIQSNTYVWLHLSKYIWEQFYK